MCRYFKRGYSKNKSEFSFAHPIQIYEECTRMRKGTKKDCQKRHPASCKWQAKQFRCTSVYCEYFHYNSGEKHDILVRDDEK